MARKSPASPAGDSGAPLSDLRERLAELRRDHAGWPSYREIAKRTGKDGITYTTVGEVLKCDRLPQWGTLKKVVIALGGDVEVFYALHQAAVRRAPDLPPKARAAHVRVNAEAWFKKLKHPGVSEGLLHGSPAGELTPDLAVVDAFVRGSLPKIQVEVQTAFQSRPLRVDSVDHFWTVMLVDSVLSEGSVGVRRWLLSETDEIRRRDPAAFEHVRGVWQWMFDTYLSSSADVTTPGLLKSFVDETLDAARTDHNLLYRGVSLLLAIAKNDPPSVRLIRESLQQHDQALRADGCGPKMLEKLRVLIADAGHDLYTEGLQPFRHDLVTFPAGRVCPYEFRAMWHPLTVGDIEAILGRTLGTDLAKPFVLDQPPGTTAFGGTWRELTHIISYLPPYDEGVNWRWDIPTVAEWLTLAGCLDQPFPWGHQPPTPLRANLKWNVKSQLRPVGTLVAGRSAADVYDCCGGVHEIVRELPHERFVSDERFAAAFRLAGGSYWTPPAWADCRKFRQLAARVQGGPQSTVGIRLIVYREQDEELRWKSLKAFRVARQPKDR